MFFRTTSSAIALIALTAPAFAEVTPAEVWQNWVDYYKANGYTVTEGSRDEAGETLTLKNVVIDFTAPEDEGKVEFTMPEVTLTATGDGKVRTTLAEVNPIKGVFKNEDGEQVQLDATVTMKDAENVSGGSMADMTHESKVAEMVVMLESVTTPEGKKPLPVTLTFKNVASRQRNVDGDLIEVDSSLSADRFEMSGNLEGLNKEDPTAKFMLNGGMDALAMSATAAMPKGVDISKDINAGFKAGLAINGTFSVGAGKFDVQFTGKDENEKPFAGSVGSEFKGGSLTGSMSASGISYQVSSDQSSVNLVMPTLPKPVSYSVEGSTFDLQFPIMKADAPAPFKLAYSISGLAISDDLWDLVDAAKTLPRTPASLDLDITGLAKITMDLFDPANLKSMEQAAGDQSDAEQAADAAAPADGAMPADKADAGKNAGPAVDGPDATMESGKTGEDDAMAEDMADAEPEMPSPFQPTEITINKIALDAAGAKIDLSGALSAPGGGDLFEEPVGKISARLDGVNGLIDNLVKIGLIAQDDVAGYRMMLAMFTKAAPEGGDAMVGDYEFKEGGEVFANGQKVK